MLENKIGKGGNDQREDRDVDCFTVMHHSFPVFSQMESAKRQEAVPKPCADYRIEGKFPEIHSGHAGWKRD